MNLDPHNSPPPPGRGEQRESIRRNFLRANSAVTIILVAVLGLALAAVLASLRATRHQRLAEQAQEAARTELWHTHISKARAARLGSALDRRQESLRAVASAARIQPSLELRHEAIAALALTDFVLEQSWPLSDDVTTQGFDKELQRYAVGGTNGDIAVRRVSDNRVVQWLRQTNAEVARPQGSVIGLEFSPTADRLVARYQRGGAVVWDLDTAKPVFRQAVDRQRQPLSRPRFTSDGRFLVCMTAVPREGVSVFDLATGESVAHFPQFKPWMHAAPRPGTTMFSVNTETNIVLVLDWRTGQTVMSFPFPAAVQRMAWSSDGKYLALGGNTVDVHLWHVETGHRRILTGHTADVRNLVFDPSGGQLASASWDGTSRIWETRSGRLLGVTEQGFAEQFGAGIRPSKVHRMHMGPGPDEASTWAMDLSPDGRWLASLLVDKELVIWDLMNGTTPGRFDMPGVRLLCFHPDRPELYLTSERETAVRKLTFDTTTTPPTLRLGDAPPIPLPPNFSSHWLALSRNGQTAALGSFFEGRTFVTDLATPEKVVWLKDLGHLTRLEAQSPAASATGGGTLALSRDGRWAVCGFVHPHGTKVWDARTGGSVATLSSENTVVEFSPDDRWIAAGDRSQFQLFRSGDWQKVWQVPREGVLLTAGPCAFSPDGRQLAVAKSPQNAAILDTASGNELAQLVAPRPAAIKTIRWSLDGRRIVIGTSENLVQVWELDALRTELASFGLNWDRTATAAAGGPALARLARPAGVAWALVLGLLAAGVAAPVALLALRRHRRLIEDFANSEALAGQRERELQVERDAGKLKSSFVSMVSHEFRTPLGVITASTGNLQRYFSRLSEAERAQLLGDITSSTSRMKDLIEEVLLLGKVESGAMKCQPVSVDLPALCRRAIAEVMAATGGTRLVEFRSDILNREALLDETLSSILLINLLDNAVKYSQAGGVVSLNLQRDGRYAVLEVRDQGIGIPLADQKQLFKSFHRGLNVGALPGTGLGLTIVKRCVDLHGGRISFVTSELHGTTFTVRLPAFS
jgi:signal transduction histidine kinase